MIRLPTCDRRYQRRRQKEKHDETIRKLEERDDDNMDSKRKSERDCNVFLQVLQNI
jgi:hypothetical protein